MTSTDVSLEMSATNDNMLEKGYWEPAKLNTNFSTPDRIMKIWTDFTPPSYFTRSRKPLRRTAYLDGLRGFAAFLVYWHHHQLWARESILADVLFERGFGFGGKYYFAAFPGIRTFFSGGHFSVTVFFVISGYVLSTKPMSLVHAGEHLKLSENLCSALFRRWLRLFIPVICITWLYMTSWHVFGIWVAGVAQETNYRAELWKWYAEFKNFSFVFSTGGEPWLSYDLHVWSIPVEFKGSIVVFTALLAFSRATRNARLLCTIALIYYFIYIADGIYFALFCSGMLLCDLDLLAENDNLPSFLNVLEPFKELIFYHLFILSVWLGGIPSHNNDINEIKKVRGWYYLSFLKPQAVFDYKWFFLFWAATFMVASVPRIPWLKKFFELPFNQWLGKISFALYLVHGPVIWTIGDRVYSAVGWTREAHKEHIPGWMNLMPLSKSGPLGFELSFWIPQLILLPLTLWCANTATKLFDEPSVKFSQWLYRKTLAPAPQTKS